MFNNVNKLELLIFTIFNTFVSVLMAFLVIYIFLRLHSWFLKRYINKKRKEALKLFEKYQEVAKLKHEEFVKQGNLHEWVRVQYPPKSQKYITVCKKTGYAPSQKLYLLPSTIEYLLSEEDKISEDDAQKKS